MPSGWSQKQYFGFDKNEYPGDTSLPALHRRFAFSGYWLNPPPGAARSTWTGKRSILLGHGFGFMILYNGRLDAQLVGKDAAGMGRADAADAVATAKKEGFPQRAVLFLDQEEGGRLLPEQSAYLFAWIESIRGSQYRPGVYCSGILVPDGTSTISTAMDIRSRAEGRNLALWVADDQCPPAPGCVLPGSGVEGAVIWQYAQSPRTQYARQCAKGYAADGNCYAPGVPGVFLDLDVSASPDPSGGK